MSISKDQLQSWFLGSRKFIVMLLVAAIAVAFRATGWINGSECVDLIKTVGVGFMACNSVEHMCTTAKDWLASQVGGDDGKDA